MDFKDKVALVTGGAHRVGKEIALMCARAGAHVVIDYHTSESEAHKTIQEIAAMGVSALAVQCDVADLASVQAMGQQVEEQFGAVDILINGASLFRTSKFPTDDFSSWHRVTSVSIDGVYYVSNTFAPGMLAKQAGTIINIVDLSVWCPWPNFGAHAVGKAGIMALTRQMALELAPSIRVNAVAPGPVLPPPNYDQDRLEAAAARTLLKRWGTPADVAHAVRFLVEAEYVTGEVIVVDGGERLGQRV